MLFDDALKALDGQSVGGQLIVNVAGVNVLVGHYSNGELIEEQSTDAQVLLDMAKEDAKPARKPRPPAAPAPEPVIVDPNAPAPAGSELKIGLSETVQLADQTA